MSVHRWQIDGLTVRGVPTPDRDGRIRSGFFLARDGLTGWGGGLSMLAEDIPRTSGDGTFPTPARYGARVTAWRVHTLAHSKRERAELDELLTGLGGGRERFTVIGEQDGIIRSTLARCGEIPAPVKERRRRAGGIWVSTSDFQLVHADPFLYGPEQSAGPGTSIVLDQRGAVEAWPVLEVAGTGAPYTVTGGGAAFIMTTPLPVGQVDRIDAATRSVVRGGAQLMTGFSGWVAPVPRGGHPATYTVTAGAITGTVRSRHI